MEPYLHKVQYYETDQMGIVHHSNYIRWFEEARLDLLEKLGMGYYDMEKMGIISPVLSAQADYLRMVKYGTEVEIHVSVKEYNGIKLAVDYQVIDLLTGMVSCKGTTRHCFLNDQGRPLSLKRSYPEIHKLLESELEKAKELEK